MAATGHAAFTVHGRAVVVVVDNDPVARLSVWVALAVLPSALVLKWIASSDTALALSPVTTQVSIAGSVALGVLLVVSLVRGTARARLFVDNEALDELRWSTAPKRKLETKLGESKIEAEIDTSSEREIKLFVDGNVLRSVKVV
ncbi:MAG: hypothetical protein JNK05_21325 [Myxococcales bacterium]|nr:hypothetical protein [Myxococcales bacterium]